MRKAWLLLNHPSQPSRASLEGLGSPASIQDCPLQLQFDESMTSTCIGRRFSPTAGALGEAMVIWQMFANDTTPHKSDVKKPSETGCVTACVNSFGQINLTTCHVLSLHSPRVYRKRLSLDISQLSKKGILAKILLIDSAKFLRSTSGFGIAPLSGVKFPNRSK